MQIYNEKEQENVQFEEKGGTRQCNRVESCAQGDKQTKAEPDAKQNKGNSNLGAGPHQLTFQFVKMELKKSLRSEGNY